MAGTITFSGLGTSGLDTSSWVEALVSVKQTTITSLQAQQQQKQELLSVVSSIKSFFTSFQTALQKITDTRMNTSKLDLFAQNLAISSNTNIVTATATHEAARQSYDVLVEKLASSTKASSGYTRQESVKATLDTTLGDLGAKSGTITVNSKSFSITENDTIKTLIQKFSDVGVIASFDEKKSRFTVSCQVSDIQGGEAANTNLINALKLNNTTITGATSGSIVYADSNTSLSKLGVTAGTVSIEGATHTIAKSGDTYTIKKDGTATATNINTLGQFLTYLTGAQVGAESATIDGNGNISIRGAVIESGTSNIKEALNLGDVTVRTVMQSNDLTFNKTNVINWDTEFGQLGWMGTYSLTANGTLVGSFNADSSFQDIKDAITTYNTANATNIVMDIDENGAITLDINDADLEVDGTLIDRLGLEESTDGTKLTSDAHNVYYSADGSTLLSTLGVTNAMQYTAKDSDGNSLTGSLNNCAGLTIDQFVAKLNTNGLNAYFDETTGKIVIEDGYIEGTLATQLGMGEETIYKTVIAEESTKLEKLGVGDTGTKLLIDGVEKSYAKTDDLAKVITDIETAGGTVTFRDGTMTVQGVTLSGALAATLGFEAVAKGTSVTSGALTVITNTSSTSTGALTEISENELTWASKIGDITGTNSSYTLSTSGLSKFTTFGELGLAVGSTLEFNIEYYDGSTHATITVSSTDTLADLENKLEENSCAGATITISGNNVSIYSNSYGVVSGTGYDFLNLSGGYGGSGVFNPSGTVSLASETFTSTMTLTDVKDFVETLGGTMDIVDGKYISIDGLSSSLQGTLVTALKLGATGRGTDMTSGSAIRVGGTEEVITEQNTLYQVAGAGNKTLVIKAIDGDTTLLNKTYAQGTKLETILADINGTGMTATIENGVITLKCNEVAYATGTLLAGLGLEVDGTCGSISTVTDLTYISETTSTSSAALTPTVTGVATLDSKLSEVTGETGNLYLNLGLNTTFRDLGATGNLTFLIDSDYFPRSTTFEVSVNDNFYDFKEKFSAAAYYVGGGEYSTSVAIDIDDNGVITLNYGDQRFCLRDSDGFEFLNLVDTGAMYTSVHTGSLSNYPTEFSAEDKTLRDVKEYIEASGGTFEIAENGKIIVSGVELSGSLATALGLQETSESTEISSNTSIRVNQEFLITGSTALSKFSPADKNYAIYDTYGNVIQAASTTGVSSASATVNNWLATINSAMNTYYGTTGKTYASVDNGVISIDGGYVIGGLADALGIQTQSTTTGAKLTGSVAQYTEESKFIGQVSSQNVPTDGVRVSSLTAPTQLDNYNDIFYISDAADLQKLAEFVNAGYNCAGKTFVLTNDIDMSGVANFTPIGSTSTNSFKGTFLGNGYEIKNLKQSTSTGRVGLFAYINGATIKDLGLSDVSITQSTAQQFGALVGYATNSTIDNCYVDGGTVNGYQYVAGLVGYFNGGTIKNTYTNLEIVSSNPGTMCAAGFVDMFQGTMENCYSSGTMSVTTTSASYVSYSAGFVRNLGNSSSIINSYSDVDITAAGSNNNASSVVGFVYTTQATSSITNCYSMGNVSVGSSNYKVGAFSTSTKGTFNNCYYNSEATMSGGTTYAQPSAVEGRTLSAILADASLPQFTSQNITRDIALDTTMARMGLTTDADRTISITVDGTTYTDTFAANETTQDVLDFLNGITGVTATYEDSQIKIQTPTSQNLSVAGKVATKLFGGTINKSDVYATSNVKDKIYYKDSASATDITTSTRVGDLIGTEESGTLNVDINGASVSLTYSADDTVGDIIDDLAAYGVIMSISNGVVNMSSNDKVIISGVVGNALLGVKGTTTHSGDEYVSGELIATTSPAFGATTTLESLGIASGSIQLIDNNGNYISSIDIDNSKTLGELRTQLSAYGFTTVLYTATDTVSITANKDVRLIDGTSNLVSGLKLDTWTPTETEATEDTTLSQLGFKNGGTINLSIDGNTYNLTFGANNTLGDVMSTLEGYDMKVSLDANGAFTAWTNSGGREFVMSGDLGSRLNQIYVSDPSNDYVSEQHTYTTSIINMNENTTVAELIGDSTTGTVRLTYGSGQVVDLTYESDDTVQDIMDDLTNLGFEVSLTDGKFSTSYINDTFDITGNLGRAIQGTPTYSNFDNKYYSTEDLTYTLSATASNATTLNELGITSGQIFVTDSSGNIVDSIDIDNSMTIAETKSALATYGFGMSIDTDSTSTDYGKVTISSNDGYRLTDGSSNLVSMMQLDDWNNTTTELSSTATLAQMGFKDGADLNILLDGTNPTTISFGSTNTVQDIINSLGALGITAAVDPDTGIFSASSTSHSFVFSGDLGKFLTNGTAGYINTDKAYISDEPISYQQPVVTNTSDVLGYTNTLSADDTVASMGFENGGVVRLIMDGDTSYSFSFLATDTMQDIMDTLSTYGIRTTIDTATGRVSFDSPEHTFTLGGELGSYIVQGGTYDDVTTEYTSPAHTFDTTEDITGDTKLSQLGVSTGELNVVKDGTIIDSIAIDNDTTVDQFLNALKVYDVTGSIETNAATGKKYIQLYGQGDIQVVDGTCDAVTKMNLNVVNQGDYDSHVEYWEASPTTAGLLTRDTLLTSLDKDTDGDGNIDVTAVGSLIFELGTGDDKTQHIINISATDTIGTLIDRLNAEGAHAVLDNGVLKIDNSVNGIDFLDTSSSGIFDTMGITEGADIATYATSNADLTYMTDVTKSVANYADKNTLLSTVNVTAGKMSIYVDGVKCEVNVEETDTFNTLFGKITSATGAAGVTVKAGFVGADGSISADNNTGIVGIEVVGDHSIVVGASNDKTNFATIANLEQVSDGKVQGSRALYKVNVNSKIMTAGLFREGNVTAGDFVIGNATFTIDANTTFSDLINQINKSEDSYASAYWDTLSGTLVLQSTLTGESLINIETSPINGTNFTDIMGFTEVNGGTESLVTDVQKLGSNAQVRINGTLVTSVSNTITSDISKIKGLTINLKNVSAGETVTITVEQDDEGIYNAVSDAVDAYNALMDTLEKESGENGALEQDNMFKMIKNNLKNLMTRSVGGTLTYKNLSAIGISTGEAQDSISTDVSSLIIDKDKFMMALDDDSDAVKQLLVGTDLNKGVFLQAYNIATNHLNTTGYLSTTEKSINKDITKIGKKVSKLTTQLAHYRQQLETKFQNMENIISGMQTSYSTFLSG